MKAASAELEWQSGQLAAILENTRAGILLVDGEGRICRANRGAELLFGLTASELEGHEAARLTAKADAEVKRAASESELAQAQKLESLGTLSAGIAHKINTPVQFVSDNVHFLKEAAGDLDAVFTAYAAVAEAIDSGGDLKAALTAARAAEAEADLAFVREEMPPALDQALVGLAQITKIVSAIKVFAHPGLQDRADFNLNESIETTVTVSASQWKHVAELEMDLQDGLPLDAGKEVQAA